MRNIVYLVKSVWNKEKKTSRQVTVKYLGESTSVTRDDIPIEFRDDPKINSFLLENTPKDRKNREDMLERLQAQLFSSMTEGDLKETIRIYELFVDKSNIEQFYKLSLIHI